MIYHVSNFFQTSFSGFDARILLVGLGVVSVTLVFFYLAQKRKK